jgi:hypothetical protein
MTKESLQRHIKSQGLIGGLNNEVFWAKHFLASGKSSPFYLSFRHFKGEAASRRGKTRDGVGVAGEDIHSLTLGVYDTGRDSEKVCEDL